jgi:hypothetical protein
VRSPTRLTPVLAVVVALAGCGKETASKPAATRAAPAAPAAPLPPGLPPGEVQSRGDPRAALFLAKGCPQCHTISALGVKSPNEIGPDLSFAYTDVQNRFGVKLDEFLAAPTGTMQMVLGQLITLTPTERDSIIHVLTRLHDEQEGRGERSEEPIHSQKRGEHP